MALPVLDPALFPYGSVSLTLSTAGVLIADDISIDRPTKSIRRTNATDVPSGQVIIADFVTGSATLQIPLSNSTWPVLGETFSYGGTTYIVTSLGERKAKDAVWSVGITFAAQIN